VGIGVIAISRATEKLRRCRPPAQYRVGDVANRKCFFRFLGVQYVKNEIDF
jgi:hypothetical protein